MGQGELEHGLHQRGSGCRRKGWPSKQREDSAVRAGGEEDREGT